MAEVVKKKEEKTKYKLNTSKEKEKKPKKASKNKNVTLKSNEKKEKKNLWVRFRTFCHGVKSETKKVHWPTKEEMIKYSIATVVFIVFCSLFFYAIDIIFAFFQSLVK